MAQKVQKLAKLDKKITFPGGLIEDVVAKIPFGIRVAGSATEPAGGLDLNELAHDIGVPNWLAVYGRLDGIEKCLVKAEFGDFVKRIFAEHQVVIDAIDKAMTDLAVENTKSDASESSPT